MKLFLDPGHGGNDPGAASNGLQEKNLTLAIALEIRDILQNEYENVSIKMSRTKDEAVSLSERTNAANNWGATYYLSIHINAGGGTGFESYIYPGVGSPTTKYQTAIHNEVIKLNQLKNRGEKQANFHVLRESNMPALLTENGFIDSDKDAEKMKSSEWIKKVATGHVNGIAKAFQLKKKDTAVYHTVVKGDTVYSLSKEYSSTIEQIKNWNKLDANYTIYVGQKLRVK